MTILSFAILAFTYNWITGSSAAPFNTSLIKPEWDSRFFPNPLLHPSKCGRGLNKSFICDPEKILNPIQAKQLDDLIDAKTRTFRCTCQEKCISNSDRYVIMVAIVPRVKVRTGATIDEKKQAVDDFAKALQRRHWAAGNCDNDIVIVLSTEYRRLHAVAGVRINKFAPEGCLVSMINESAALLTDGFYFMGVYNFIDALSLNIQREDCVDKGKASSSGGMTTPPWVVYVVGGIIAIIFISMVLFGIRRFRRYRHLARSRRREPGPNVVYRPASRELVDQYEGGSHTSPGESPYLDVNSTTRTPISRSHAGVPFHNYDNNNSPDGYGVQGGYRPLPVGGDQVATFAGKETRKIMNNSCILNATKAVSLLLELDRYFAVIQELVWVYSTNLNKTMCANEPPLQGGPAKHPVVLYVILAILAGIGVTILVWVTRLCIKGCIHRKKKAKLEEENVGTDKSIKMETTVVYSPKSGVGIDAEMDTKSEDSKEDRHERQKSKSNEQVSSSPKAGTSSEGASGYTPRKGRNPGSFRDKRPSLSLDLSKCKHMDDDTAKAKKAERQGFLETQY